MPWPDTREPIHGAYRGIHAAQSPARASPPSPPQFSATTGYKIKSVSARDIRAAAQPRMAWLYGVIPCSTQCQLHLIFGPPARSVWGRGVGGGSGALSSMDAAISPMDGFTRAPLPPPTPRPRAQRMKTLVLPSAGSPAGEGFLHCAPTNGRYLPMPQKENARPIGRALDSNQPLLHQATVLLAAFSAAMRSSSGGWLRNSFLAVAPAMPNAAIWVGRVLWP